MPEIAGKRIFVVEDEGMILALIEDLLQDLGCVIAASAATLDDALAKAEHVDADAAILDVNLAGHASTDVAAVLERRGVPFLFATGYGTAAAGWAKDATILGKPFTMRDLERALRGVMR
jgi:DNA-binding response OmpR family regulator